MKTLDLITKVKIQSRVEALVIENCNEDGYIAFDFISEKISTEFAEWEELALQEAKKQYDFMYAW